MNNIIKQLAYKASFLSGPNRSMLNEEQFLEKFAELIVQECVNTLEFHGFDDTVPYVKWMASNRLGITK